MSRWDEMALERMRFLNSKGKTSMCVYRSWSGSSSAVPRDGGLHDREGAHGPGFPQEGGP